MTTESEIRPNRRSRAVEEQPAPPEAEEQAVPSEPPEPPAPPEPPDFGALEQGMNQQWGNLQNAQRAHKAAAQAVTDTQSRLDQLSHQLEGVKADLSTRQSTEAETKAALREAMAAVGAAASKYGSAL